MTVSLSHTADMSNTMKSANEDRYARKLRGGYYTPGLIARFLTSWAVRSPDDVILEPACGDGVFVEEASLLIRDGDGTVTAIEIVESEAVKAQNRGGPNTDIVVGDIFEWWHSTGGHEGKFDAVLGNPPFLGYHSFPSHTRDLAFTVMRQEALNPTKLTNAWLPFVVLATRALRQGGRLAFVVPVELLQVNYAAELRRYLVSRFGTIRLILFRSLIFEGLQQEVLLLLAERDDNRPAELRIDEVATVDDLDSLLTVGPLGERSSSTRTIADPTDHDKWTQYLLDTRTIGLMREVKRSGAIPRLGDYGTVNVGVLTGNNKFFVLTAQRAKEAGIDQWCVPLVSQARQIPHPILTEADWRHLRDRNDHVLLFNAGEDRRCALPDPVREYISAGERAGMNSGYKCRARSPTWWRLPKLWVPDVFMIRHIHEAPRLAANTTDATCTITLLRQRVNPGVDAAAVATAAMNSMTLAFSEIIGRSYGGGVLDLPPREASALPIPLIGNGFPSHEVDQLVRQGAGVERVADTVDKLTLQAMGLPHEDINLLRTAWRTLSLRRRARGRTRRTSG